MADPERTRTLILMRHAKSDWPVGVQDSDRPLAARGRRDAPAAAAWIRNSIGLPELIVTSPAERTRQTVELLLDTWSAQREVVIDDRIYEAEVRDLVTVVEGLPDGLRTALLVGHNPGLEQFASTWPSAADPQASQTLTEKFPTSAIAVIDVAGAWGDRSSAVLRRVDVPRG